MTNTGTIQGAVNLGSGNDVMTGGANSDFVLEHAGADKHTLGDSFDLLKMTAFDLFKDTLDGGKGTDILLLSNEGLSLDLTAKTLKQIGLTDATGAYTDSVVGFEQVMGGTGNDSITGAALAESLAGGAGNDTITGMGGKDVLYGNGGNDVFVFKTAADSTVARAGRDIIMDYTSGNDQIQLTFDAKTATKTVVDAFDYETIQYGAFTKDGVTGKYVAGQLRYHYEAGNTVLRGDTNGDGLADFAIEVKGHHEFSATDFLFTA